MEDQGSPSSRIALTSSDDRFVFETRARGFHGLAIGQLVGGLLVLAVCAQWTGRTVTACGVAGAGASVPFWLLGLGVAGGALHRMIKHHRVDLRADGGWIRTFPIGRKKPLHTQTLAVRLDHVTRGEADGRGGTEVPVLVLDDGRRVFRLMEGFTDAECAWVGTELTRWLGRRSGPA
jgi:hypothetical protein